jgi:serine/threonine protein kinase
MDNRQQLNGKPVVDCSATLNSSVAATATATTSTPNTVKRDNASSFYKIGRKIGSGTFGELRLGKHVSTKCLVAIKIEPKSAKVPQLWTEYQNYLLLGMSHRKHLLNELMTSAFALHFELKR